MVAWRMKRVSEYHSLRIMDADGAFEPTIHDGHLGYNDARVDVQDRHEERSGVPSDVAKTQSPEMHMFERMFINIASRILAASPSVYTPPETNRRDAVTVLVLP